jgi:thiosulfate/3-mercaptopyruvate sulfurtransferase
MKRMIDFRPPCSPKIISGLAAVLALAVGIALLPLRAALPGPVHPAQSPSDPWTSAQVVEAADLVKELSDAGNAKKPLVVCVGFHTFFKNAHVPGAVLHGPGNSESGLADLKKWAQGLPRSANLVVYCGCCPLAGCPNLRPGFQALRDMGFQNLRVLLLPNSFAVDWVEKGYPTEKEN